MPSITLPDGKTLHFDKPLKVSELAQSIGPGLAKVAIAAKVGDKLVDLGYLLDQDATVSIITDRDAEGLDVIRHSCAHLLAQAVQTLFPKAQVTIGPVIEDGFYYDFAFERPFTPEDLLAIESVMHKLAAEDLIVHRKILSRRDAIALFKEKGENYKVEIIQDIPGDEPLSFYTQGNFIDLCRGPHVPSTGKIKAFKLTKVAGAYWRGDIKNTMLQRIYGTAWANKKDLDAYLLRLEEAEKRDHRKIGKNLDLFHLQEEAPGMVFWHPKGWIVYQVIEQYIRNLLKKEGYQEVRTPQVVNRNLWERSGHWATFRNNMFTLQIEDKDFAIKPMSCPCHVQIFNQGLRSYRDLPLRMSEFGSCHRNEPSGALHGLLRVRHFVQDDGHIFCTEAQIQEEVVAFNTLLLNVYRDFGFDELIIKLATRPKERVGSDDSWDKAEAALKAALKETGLAWTLSPGEGAFYGPKIEYSCKDSLGRVWQCGTVQVDFSMPERLGASYIGIDGERHIPVMIHRAIIGTFERFIGILIEATAGAFPAWLAPVQAIVLTITESQGHFATEVANLLESRGLRATTDLRNEKIGFKIREHTLEKVPYLLVVGDREVENRTLSVRTREGEDLGQMTPEAFADMLLLEVAKRGRRLMACETTKEA